MRTQRLLQGLLPLLIAGLSYTGSTVAAETWYTCSIDTIGSQAVKRNGKTSREPVIQLDEMSGAFLDQQFIFKSKGRTQSQMLAIALAAASNGFEVEVLTDLDSGKTPLRIKEINLIVTP